MGAHPFGAETSGAGAQAAELAQLVNRLVHAPIFTVAEVLPLAAADVRRPADAAFLLRALADRLDPSRAAWPVPLEPVLSGPFAETRVVRGARDTGQVLR